MVCQNFEAIGKIFSDIRDFEKMIMSALLFEKINNFKTNPENMYNQVTEQEGKTNNCA